MANTFLTTAYISGGVTGYYEPSINSDYTTGLWKTCPILAIMQDPSLGTIWMDDFRIVKDEDGTENFYDIAGDTPLFNYTDGANGQAVIEPTNTTDNHASTIYTLSESWLIEANKELWFEARVKLTEQNTDDANILVGLTDSAGADVCQDNGGGPPASHDGIVWAKVDGGTVWQFEVSNAAAQTTTADAGDFTSGSWHRLGFHFDGDTTATPYLDGVAGNGLTLTLASLDEMELCMSVKNGGANKETLYLDYVKVVQIR
ncbi:MAG: hypothetical protein CMB80_02715 [Flammeovirgaceae bacterium]|nr:hypothetical protein [Flammeovirgaceae bacterium]